MGGGHGWVMGGGHGSFEPPRPPRFNLLQPVCHLFPVFRFRLIDTSTSAELVRTDPGEIGDHTTVFLARIVRLRDNSWVVNAIGEFDHTARDFGSVIPEIKGYCADIIPGTVVNPNEKIALMRKGGFVRLSNYAAGHVVDTVTFGLAWDVTNGCDIDLDASVIVLDQYLSEIDTVWFKQLRSRDGAIKHCGDEREGDEEGDDEQIDLKLSLVDDRAVYLGFCVNSYSGEPLNKVAATGCHIFDTRSKHDFASFKMTGMSDLKGKTALIMGILYRDPQNPLEWMLHVCALPGTGKVVKNNVGNLQAYITTQPKLMERQTMTYFGPPTGAVGGPPAGPPPDGEMAMRAPAMKVMAICNALSGIPLHRIALKRRGVAIDTTGDGVADAIGYDTTGDGKIDAVDTNADGLINVNIGASLAAPGTAIEDTGACVRACVRAYPAAWC